MGETTEIGSSLRREVEAALPRFRETLREMVNLPSNSRSPEDLRRSAEQLVRITNELLPGIPVTVREITGPDDGRTRPFLVVGSLQPRCLLIAHHDMVLTPTADFFFEDHGDRVSGPGVHDDKGSILTGLMAMQLVNRHVPGLMDEIALYIGADEEIGTRGGLLLLNELTATVEIALGLEGSEIEETLERPAHPIKVGRKGISCYLFEYFGRSGHAGHAERQRADANRQLVRHAHLLEEYAATRPSLALNIGYIRGGVSSNQVSDSAMIDFEARSFDLQELEEFDAFVRTLTVHDDCPGVDWTLTGQIDRPPFPTDEKAMAAFNEAERISQVLGLREVLPVQSGGLSDICLVPPGGIRLDGLACLGNGDHTKREWLDMTTVPDCIIRMAGLMVTLSGRSLEDLSH